MPLAQSVENLFQIEPQEIIDSVHTKIAGNDYDQLDEWNNYEQVLL